jgi:hypothetical protein
MTLVKPQIMVLMMTVAALAVVARAGVVVDLLLLLIAAFMFVRLSSQPYLPGRVRWVLAAFTLLFVYYLTLTLLSPTRTGIVNVIGILITGIVFFYFVQNARRLIEWPGTGAILLLSGCLIGLIGTALGVVSKNTISGIVVYFFLSAGVVWLMRGVSLRRVSFWIFLLLATVGILLGHRLMVGSSLAFLAVVVTLRVLPMSLLRNLVLAVVVGGLFAMIVLYAGLWGFDVRDLDSWFIEYTGRTARSGRQIIWPLIIAFTAESPWVGLGTGMTFSNLYDSDWSAHSYFLQVYMQSGRIGIGCLLLLLFTVWAAIGRPNRSQPIKIYATACFLVLLIHVSFEVFLMQVNLLMGCCAWMMLGLAIGCIRSAESSASYSSFIPRPGPVLPAEQT